MAQKEMRKRFSRLTLLVLFVLSLSATVRTQAQGDSPLPVAPVPVQTSAADGLTLAGDFYLVDAAHPTVLLLHQLYTDRTSWNVLLPPLLNAGYNALAVDLRGHGQTGGGIDWNRAVTDVQSWFDWLHASGVRADTIVTIGSSMGSSLALVGCANDPGCPTAIAISPGWSYQGLSVAEAFTAKLVERPVLLVFSARDGWPRLGVPRMIKAATGQVGVLQYPGNVHGMNLFDTQGDTLIPLIIDWLNEYTG
jgi:pimeloyl-ACP methyl ester carboxylesterase